MSPFAGYPADESPKLNPWYITGFADGESSFSFSITKTQLHRLGWTARLVFNLVAADNPANRKQFEKIRDFFGVGKIVEVPAQTPTTEPAIYFVVRSLRECLVIRKHFENYPLLTTKLVYFKLWCLVIDLVLEGAHLTEEGLNKIVALKLYSKKGLSDLLKLEFPYYINYNQPEPEYDPNLNNLNIHWICGFANADGHFKVQIQKSVTHKMGVQCVPVIKITQHTNSIIVLKEIQNYLGLGFVPIRKTEQAADFTIRNLKEANLFIEKFKEAKLESAKALDYLTFCNIITMMNNKQHLTAEGLAQIKQLNSNVNSNRTIFIIEDEI